MMSLRDVLIGIQNGPRGARQPGSGGGGMSPLVLALLGLLAYKAFKGRGGQTPAPPEQDTVRGGTTGAPGGGLGDILGRPVRRQIRRCGGDLLGRDCDSASDP
jgi:hypothetical protein